MTLRVPWHGRAAQGKMADADLVPGCTPGPEAGSWLLPAGSVAPSLALSQVARMGLPKGLLSVTLCWLAYRASLASIPRCPPGPSHRPWICTLSPSTLHGASKAVSRPPTNYPPPAQKLARLKFTRIHCTFVSRGCLPHSPSLTGIRFHSRVARAPGRSQCPWLT